MDAVEYLDLLLKALLLAGVYAAMAVGMTVVYGVMKIVNLAHAGFLMLGAYFALEMFQRFHIDPVLGAVLALPAFRNPAWARFTIDVEALEHLQGKVRSQHQ